MEPTVFYALVLFMGCSTGSVLAAKTPEVALPERQLQGLSDEEADSLISKLEAAQGQLDKGEFQSFALLSGSIASYRAALIPPREAFLSTRFADVWNIERLETDTRLWNPYRLSYAPNGLGQLYWDIEVVLGFNGDIEKVTMLYRPPAPF